MLWFAISAAVAIVVVVGVWAYWELVLSDDSPRDPRNGL